MTILDDTPTPAATQTDPEAAAGGNGTAKPAHKAKSKPKAAKPAKKAAPAAAPKAAKAKAAKPKAKAAKKAKANGQRKRDPAKLDPYGYRLGSIRSKAANMYANKSGATLAEVKAKVGTIQFNVLTELKERGFKIKRVPEPSKSGREVTRFFVQAR